MKTIILPGYSPHNKDWAERIANQMSLNQKVLVYNWKHWSGEVSFSPENEIKQILNEVGDDKINIIAKSIGVYVALKLIPRIFSQVNKVILCGIASVVDEGREELLQALLKIVPIENILCIQNENDKYVPFIEAQKFYHSIDPKLKVISKARSDHEYPYSGDFKDFLQA